jgi:hypothetical protein
MPMDGPLHRPYLPEENYGVTAQLARALIPYNYGGPNDGTILLIWSFVIAAMFDTVDAIVRDENVSVGQYPRFAPGYSQVLDTNRVPTDFLNWLGQFAGHPVYLQQSGETDADYRERVTSLFNSRLRWERGTPAAMRRAVEETLTGTKQLYLIERAGGPWKMTAATLTAETPDPVATEHALRLQKPAGIVLTYVVITGGTWLDVLGTHADWDEVATDFTDWNEVLTDPTNT